MFPTIVKEMLQRTILIETKFNVGTGFCLDENGLAGTCRHVIEDRNKQPVSEGIAHIPLFEKSSRILSYQQCNWSIVRTDLLTDFALIQIEDIETKPIQMYEGIADIGEDIGMTGFPFAPDLKHTTTTKGIISGYHPQPDIEGLLYQISEWLYEAGSGSPCYLANTGEVIGYMTEAYDPIKKLKRELEKKGIPVMDFAVFSGRKSFSALERPTNICWAMPIIRAWDAVR